MTPDEATAYWNPALYEVACCADCPNAVVRRVPGSGWFHASQDDGDICPGFGPVRAA